jgi:hypothetical protein
MQQSIFVQTIIASKSEHNTLTLLIEACGTTMMFSWQKTSW